MASKQDIFNIDSDFLPKDPDVLPPTADISCPGLPTFQYLDLPTETLESSKINKEATAQINHLKVLNDFISSAKSYIPFLYSYRSLLRPTFKPPQVKALLALADKRPEEIPADQKAAFQEATTFKTHFWNSFQNHFKPTYTTLVNLYDMCKRFAFMIVPVINNETYEHSDVIFEKLIELFHLIFNIDHMKNLKTGLINDFTNYKRAFPREQQQNDSKLSEIPFFLSTENITLSYLQQELTKATETQKIPKSIHFLRNFLEYCVFRYKNDVLIPDQRSAIVVSIFCVLTIQGKAQPAKKSGAKPLPWDPAQNIFTAPCMPQVFEILYENPVVPMYGENSFLPGDTLAKLPGYNNPTKLPIITTREELRKYAPKFLIKNNMQHFRDQYRANLAIASDMVRKNKISQDGLMSLLSCISEMTLAIQKQAAFKFICPAQRPDYATKAKTGQDELNYDLGVKFNYDADDQNALIEIIGCIKTLSATTVVAEPLICEYAYTKVYTETQEFIKNTIERPLVRARQTDQKDCIQLLEKIRELWGHWKEGELIIDLPAKTKALKKHIIEPGLLALSPHQLDILRIQLNEIIKTNSPFTTKISMFQLSHFRPKHVQETVDFLANSRPWYNMLNYIPFLRESSNLAFLWLRETSLDIDDALQFPVRSSLPFILCEHVLNASDKPALHDSTFFPFELYNDAAYSALNVFRSQYLFHEVEAEVALCVDMIAFTFSETFYKFSRTTASTMEVPPEYVGKLVPPPMRYSVMVQQNKLELLGSPIDFNQITTTKLNTKMRKELEGYVEMFTDLRLAPYIAHLVRVARTSNSLLRENHLYMDDFDTLWQQARGFDSPLCLESKLVLQIVSVMDFLHLRLNCVSRRYVPVKSMPLKPISTEEWATEYSKIHQHEMEYIGNEHIKALKELLSPGEMGYLISVLSGRIEEYMEKVIDVYTSVALALRILPATSKDDIIGYFTFNNDAYSTFMHPKLRSLFDGMRALGNTLAFVWFLENELPCPNGSETLIAPIMKCITELIISKRALFFSEGNLDIESVFSHRSFPSLWSVLEFIICKPEAIKLEENKDPVIPIEYLGDGPIIFAHVVITLCGQSSLYKFDSTNFRALSLYDVEQASIPNEQLSKFLFNAAAAEQCRKFAELIATPYKVHFE